MPVPGRKTASFALVSSGQFFTGEENHEHEGLLRQRIADRGEISREFRSRGLTDMASAAAYIRRLPYGCNTDRGDFRRVLRGGEGDLQYQTRSPGPSGAGAGNSP